MEIVEFKHILDIGLGRAILHLQQHDAAPYREAILHACLHNSTYDVQVENRGIEYLLDVISLTGDEQFFQQRIIERLSDPSPLEDYDEYQLFNFATYFAQKGDNQARDIIYARFVQNVAADSQVGTRNIIELDGIEGFIFVINQLSNQVFVEEDMWNYDFIIWDLEDCYGEEKTRLALDKASVDNPYLKEIVLAVGKHRARREKEKYPNPSKIPFEEITRWIVDPEKRQNPPVSWSMWGKYADDDAIRNAAADLLIEENEDHLIAYLRLFQRRRFPLDYRRVIDLVQSREMAIDRESDRGLTKPAKIVSAALIALKNITAPEVRELAFRLIESPKWSFWAADLLVNNFQNGDWQFLEAFLSGEFDKIRFHSFGLSISHIFEANPSINAVPLLKQLYETSPCSNCRRHFVEHLHSLDALPDWMLEECKYDANLDLRELARNNFKMTEP